MSFEGYDEWLCENGHLTTNWVYCEEPEQCRCGSRFILYRLLDCTNGDEQYPELEVKHEERCSECGCIKETVYWFPFSGWRKL